MSVNWDDRPAASRHAIIIEDEPVVRMLLQETLTEMGFTSAGFDNAVQALTHLIHIQGDRTLLIADQGLPGGVQDTELIRMANNRWPSIPSILTSGYLIDKQVVPPSATYLHKPYTLDQLEKTIAIVLQQQPLLLQN